MSAKFFRKQLVVVLSSVLALVTVAFFGSDLKSVASEASSALVPVISATKTVAVVVGNADADADPGETLEYTVTINNTGPDPATGVAINDTIQNITTLVAGSTIASPVAVNDTFSSIGNVGISVPDGASDLLGNDFDANNPGSSAALVITVAPTTSAQGGNVSINTINGSFTYNPAPGFEGTDTFSYTLSNGTGLTDTATVTINVAGMIWFINNNSPACTTLAGGCGRLSNPLSTLAAFSALNNGTGNNPAANDNIFIFESATTYSGGTTLLANQKIIGQDGTATLAAISGVTVPTFSNALPTMNTGGNTTQLISGGINVSSGGNTIRGMTINNTAPAKISGTNFGTLTVGNNAAPDVIISGTGKAIDLNNGSFAASSGFTSVATTSSTSHGMQLISVGGTVSFGSTSVSGSASQGIFVNASNVNLNFGNTTVGATTAGEGVRLENNTGGTRTFGTLSITNSAVQGFTDGGGGNTTVTGLTTITNPANVGILISSKTAGTSVTFANVSNTQSGSHGVHLNNNAGTVTFNDLDIAADANQRGILATSNTGAITIGAGSTVANTGTATAVEITGVSAASRTPLNIQFTSVASTGAASGIILSNTSSTGAPGGFGILGSSVGLCGGSVSAGPPATAATTTAPVTADCTGGTIQNSTGSGIVLTNAENISLTRVRVINSGDDGLFGTNVTNFTMASSFFDNNGNAVNTDDGLDFGNSGVLSPNGLHGTCSITNSTIQNSYSNQFTIRNSAGPAVTCTISGNQFRGRAAENNNNDGVLFGPEGTATINATFTGNFFAANKGDHIQTAAVNSGNVNVSILNNTFTGGHSTALGQGITISAATGVPGWNGRTDYDINGNNINQAISNGASVVLGTSAASAVFDGFVRNNVIGTSGVALSCSTQANGVYIDARGNGTHNSAVTGNTIRQCFDRGILTEAGDGDSVLNLTVQSNIIDQQVDPNARESIQTNFGITSTNVFGNIDTNNVCLQLGGAGALANTFSHGAGAPDDFRLRKRFEATVRLPGYAGGTDQTAGSLAQVVAFIQGQNTGSAGEPGSASASGTGGGYTGGAACTQPTLAAQDGEPSSADSELTPADNGLSSADGELSSADSGLSSSDGGLSATILTTVTEFAAKLSEMISPTAYAQDTKPSAPESGESVNKALGTLPAGESIVVKFRATVDNGPYASGINNITNTATISGTNFSNVTSTTSSIPLDAAPDLVVTKTEGGGTTQPSGTVVYTLSYSNATATNGQNAANVALTETVPANTTFNSAASTAGWGGAGCVNGAPAGTVCTFSIGALNDGGSGSANFAVNVLAALPAGVLQVSNTSSIAENPNINGTDRNAANNTGPDSTNIIGNWLGGTSTDWFNAANWSNSVVPPSGNNVSIPNVANQPIVTTADVTLNNMNLIGENVTINAGRSVTVNGITTLGANNINGAGTLNLGTAATITRSTGQVECTLNKSFAATGLFTFPVGTVGAYSPVDVNVTAGTGQLSIKANTGTAPLAPVPLNAARTLQRYWTLNGSGITSNITFNYLNGDVPGPPNNENIWNIIRVSGGTTAVRYPPGPNVILNAAANTFTLNGVQVYSDWTAGEPLVPTASGATVAGQVFDANGRGVAGSFVYLTDGSGNVRQTITNPFGYYRFSEIPAGQSYVISVTDKRRQYPSRVVNVGNDVNGVDFVPLN